MICDGLLKYGSLLMCSPVMGELMPLTEKLSVARVLSKFNRSVADPNDILVTPAAGSIFAT